MRRSCLFAWTEAAHALVEPATELARRDPPFPSRIDGSSPDKLEAASAGFQERVLLQRFGRLGSDEAESQVRPLFERGERQQSNYRFLRPLAHTPASQPPMFTLYPPAFNPHAVWPPLLLVVAGQSTTFNF